MGVTQLRDAFKLAMQALYGARGIARQLEASPEHRGSNDRAILDGVLLWTAREIGADYQEKAAFNEQPGDKARRLSDRADVVVAAMSAAAQPSSYDEELVAHPSFPMWDDAIGYSVDWVERHRRLGLGLQTGFSGNSFPTLKRKPQPGEFVFWAAEAGLPRLVESCSGDKVILFEPGTDDTASKKIVASYVEPIDLDAIAALA